jgi:hypothetical protein
MSHSMKQCAQCGQWLNLELNRYVVGRTSHGRQHFLHQRPCAERFALQHQVVIEQVRDERQAEAVT